MKYIIKAFVFASFIIVCIAAYLRTTDKPSKDAGHKVVLCIPVYGQSLALGEEAVRMTDFDSLRINHDGRIMTEFLDYGFGFSDDFIMHQRVKRLINYHNGSFELSIYSMAEELATRLGKDTLLCIFPGGRGLSSISLIRKGTPVYNKFLYEIRMAYERARARGWDFIVPAICWMQGESDIVDYTGYDYKQQLKQFGTDINQSVKAITRQTSDIPIVCYQSNVLTRAWRFDANSYEPVETRVAQGVVELIQEEPLFWASGPTYPYDIVNEKLHIDGIGQRHIGALDAIAVLRILRHGDKTYGLTPSSVAVEGNDITVGFRVAVPPLTVDTTIVSPVAHYGFSVITPAGRDILEDVIVGDTTVRLKCSQEPEACRVRYAVNGEKMKSGRLHGPRGNLRDSQGEGTRIRIAGKYYPLHNWCYQFDLAAAPGGESPAVAR